MRFAYVHTRNARMLQEADRQQQEAMDTLALLQPDEAARQRCALWGLLRAVHEPCAQGAAKRVVYVQQASWDAAT